jgi:hypothetical protein
VKIHLRNRKKGGWLNRNIDLLLKHKDKWIAFSETKGLIASDNELHSLLLKARTITKKLVIWHLHEHFGSLRCLLTGIEKQYVYPIKDERKMTLN